MNPSDNNYGIETSFTEDEVDALLKYIEEGNTVNCNRCGTKNAWQKDSNAKETGVFHLTCRSCGRVAARGLYDLIADPIEEEVKEALLDEGVSPEHIDEDPEIRAWKHAIDMSKAEIEALKHLNPGASVGMIHPPLTGLDHNPTLDSDPNKQDFGKVMMGVLEDFLPALAEVGKLGSMNNKPNGKYERGSWMKVKNAEVLYLDAFWRHISEGRHNIDPDTGMPHDVAIAWNALALLWFRLKREGRING